MNNPILHVCSYSPKVIFRTEDDFNMVINRLAALSFKWNISVLCYSIMSTHLHMVLKGAYLSQFLSVFKKSLARYFNSKYLNKGTLLNLSKRELNSRLDVIFAVNYVLKNPIHHRISSTVFQYPFTSISCYFKNEIISFSRNEKIFNQPINELAIFLPLILRRKMFAKNQISKELEVFYYNDVVKPESFIDFKSVEMLYGNFSNFLYNMNKPLHEELQFFGEKTNNSDLNDYRSIVSNRLTDIEVCRYVSDYINNKNNFSDIKLISHIFLSENDKEQLWSYLKTRGVTKNQFDRCV